MTLILKYDDQIRFKEWLELNLDSISWEGRYLREFNTVWDLVFEPNMSVEDQFKTLNLVENSVSQGPIQSWFRWLRFKLLCYLFIYKGLTLAEVSELANEEPASVALLLRDFFVVRYPQIESELNNLFQLGNILSTNVGQKFSNLAPFLPLDNKVVGSLESEVFTDLEVTLYSDWESLSNSLGQKGIYSNAEALIKDKKFIGRQLRFLQELVVLFLIGAFLIFSIKLGNKAYEDYLVEKISLFSPNFFWLDKNLSFKVESFVSEGDLKIKLDEIKALEKIEKTKVFDDIEQTSRYEVESDVVLTSVDTLPRDFEAAGMEQSNYEEIRKGGYRDSRYGRRKAYRVMMTSVTPDLIKEKLVKILDQYKIKQVDNVKPGTQIPGGIYFNLYVPRGRLKEFLSQVSLTEKDTTILESKTVFGGPPKTNKVFIWIKSI
jgi:hypothetical protein